MELASATQIERRPGATSSATVVGDRLRWGLSAAGYLDPKVFRFFHRHGVSLCSGFGMTEGTGGLTMTPPDDYVEDSVGVPLPGVKVRFGDDRRAADRRPLHRPLPARGRRRPAAWRSTTTDSRRLLAGHRRPVPRNAGRPPGDRRPDQGHLQEQPRARPSPRAWSSRCSSSVPGIKRTFLAGDGRSYNTLLIVPDDQDDVLQRADQRRGPPRVLPADRHRRPTATWPPTSAWSTSRSWTGTSAPDKGELTPKGSYRRKAIEAEFRRGDRRAVPVQRAAPGRGRLAGAHPPLVLPRPGRARGRRSSVGPRGPGQQRDRPHAGDRRRAADGRVRIGDLEYRLAGTGHRPGPAGPPAAAVDGQPPADRLRPLPHGLGHRPGALLRTGLPAANRDGRRGPARRTPAGSTASWRGGRPLPAGAVRRPARPRWQAVVDLDARTGARRARGRARSSAAASRPWPTTRTRRCAAAPTRSWCWTSRCPTTSATCRPSSSRARPFLDDESFARHQPARHRAAPAAGLAPAPALLPRRSWPGRPPKRTRRLFEDLFRLLADFGRFHPEFYGPIREELVSWILHDADPELAAGARARVRTLAAWFEDQAAGRLRRTSIRRPGPGKIVFQEGLGPKRGRAPAEVLVGTTFLQAVAAAGLRGRGPVAGRDRPRRHLGLAHHLPLRGLALPREHQHHAAGKHFDLQVIIRQDFDQDHRPRHDLLVHRPARLPLRHAGAAQLRLLPARTGRPVHGLRQRPDGVGEDPRVQRRPRARHRPAQPHALAPADGAGHDAWSCAAGATAGGASSPG